MPDATMCIAISSLSGYGKVRRNIISLPLISELLADSGGRYFLPENAPPPIEPQGRPRGPQLKTLVKLVLEREGLAPRRR